MKEVYQYAIAAAKLTAAGYQDLTRGLEKILTADEMKAFHITVAFFRLQLFPNLARVMEEELASSMYREVNR